jgi:hypothetical protein
MRRNYVVYLVMIVAYRNPFKEYTKLWVENPDKHWSHYDGIVIERHIAFYTHRMQNRRSVFVAKNVCWYIRPDIVN